MEGMKTSLRRCARALRAVAVFVAAFSCLTMPPARRARASAPLAPMRVLLVGNSYTRFNVMPRLLARLSQSVPGAQPLAVDAEANGGFTLRMHWQAGRALSLIRSGRYERVVLQDHSLRPVDRPEEFAEYVARFTHEIEAASARAVLYATWPRHPSARLYREHTTLRTFDQMAARVGGAYRSAAAQLSASLAPVGPAFERALAVHPELALYKPDATHPTIAGSFLAACVLYGTLTGSDPRQSSYVPYELDPAAAELIKATAAETLASQPSPVPAPVPAPVPEPVPAEIPSISDTAAAATSCELPAPI
jgi:hypothetical protein